MAAYVIAQVEVTDPDKYAEYRKRVPAAIEKYQGRFLVRGGETAPLEGGWNPPRLVILEFPSLEAVRAWYDSPEYQHAKAAREGGAIMSLLGVQGV